MVRWLTFFLVACVAGSLSEKILVFCPLFAHSHSNYLTRLSEILAERGHEVHILMPIMAKELEEKISLKKVKSVMKYEVSREVQNQMDIVRKEMEQNLWKISANIYEFVKVAQKMSSTSATVCRELLEKQDMIESLRKENYTIGLAEPFTFCGFGLLEVLRIPVTVGAVSNVQMDHVSNYIGEPLAPSYVPGSFSGYGENMSFLRRVENAIATVLGINFFDNIFNSEYAIFVEKYGPSFRSISDIISDANYIFTNSNPYLNFPRPLLSKTVEIGGVSVDYGKHSSKVDEKWDKVLNERKKNVLISFGSVVKSKDMPDEFKKTILETFAEFKDVTFIWKYEEETNIADHLPNVHLSSWFPQVAILNDPRLSLFITHGGLGSTMEVSYLGKPAIYVPVFADQPRNAQMAARLGGASVLHIDDLKNKDKLKATIEKMLSDPKYTIEALKVAETLQNVPIDPRENFVNHVEFAGRVGRIPNLNHFSRFLSYIEYHLIDVLVFLLLSVFMLLYLICYLIKITVRRLFKQKTKKE